MIKEVLKSAAIISIIMLIISCGSKTPLEEETISIADEVSGHNSIVTQAAAKLYGFEGTNTRVYPVGMYSIDADATLDENVQFTEGAKLYIAKGATLTIKGYLTAGLYQIFYGDGAAILSRNSCERILPQWWGAVPDGDTDCTKAIQSAIDAAETAGGDTVWLAAGTYKLTETLIIDDSNVHLRGAGINATVLKSHQNDGTAAIRLSKADYFHGSISEMTIEGNPYNGSGLVLEGPLWHGSLQNIRTANHGGSGVEIYGGVYHWHIDGVYSRDNGRDGFHLYEFEGLRPNANTFTACNAISNNQDGYNFEATHGNTIVGGNAEGNARYGIRIGKCDSTRVLGTWIESNIIGGIDVTDDARGTILMPGKCKDDITGYLGIGYLNNPALSRTQGVGFTKISSAFDTVYAGNMMIGNGNIITLAAPDLQESPDSQCLLVPDERALVGEVWTLDVYNDYVHIGPDLVISPQWIMPGKYRAYLYAKSTGGTENAVELLVKNETDNDNLFISLNITPPVGDEFIALPAGGAFFTVDDTEQADSMKIKVRKRLVGDDENDILISHIVIVPCEDTEFPFVEFPDRDTTPSVVSGTNFRTANTDTTIIRAFDDGYNGKDINVVFGDNNTMVDFANSNLKGNGGRNWLPRAGDHMTCVFDGINWYCNLSDNTP